MSDRIDHAAVARKYITAALGAVTADPAGIVALLAQAEATLALVEQQRIANLIALGLAREGNGWRTAGPEWMRVRPDIAAALGIEVQP